MINLPTGCILEDIQHLKFYEKNPKNHTDKDIDLIIKSIKRNGWGDALLVCPETMEVLSGNGRLMAAQKLGMEQVPVIYAPKGLSEKQKADLVIASNKLVESSGYNNNLEELIEMYEIDPKEFGIELEKQKIEEEKEDFKFDTTIPQYKIKGENVDIEECFECGETNNLIKTINDSSVTEKEKILLIIGAYRRSILNYRKIAEYYVTKASGEMQALMEKMGLVIIDYDDAIANGFTTLTEELGDMIDE